MLVVKNRLQVAEEHTREFVDLFEERTGQIRELPGFRGAELLAPVDADEYVIQAYWESRDAFESWRGSEAFERAHAELPAEMFRGSNQLEVYERALTVEDTG